MNFLEKDFFQPIIATFLFLTIGSLQNRPQTVVISIFKVKIYVRLLYTIGVHFWQEYI